MIKFKNVSKTYADGTTAVDTLNFTINKGEFFVLIGPSGCGKTTTLKLINRLIRLTEGTIFIDEKRISDYDIHQLRWNIGYVLQQIALFPHMSIEENIAIVPEMRMWDESKIKNRVTELLEMVGLDPDTYRHRKPNELSVGEQQRVGVVRALAADPAIILMDEPFSALDPISREKLQDDMISLQKRINKTIVFVTHDMKEAIKLADRICLMDQGKIVQLGTPRDIVQNPCNDFVQDFIGASQTAEAAFSLEKSLLPVNENQPVPEDTIHLEATLAEVIEKLTKAEEIGVYRENQFIGKVNRQVILEYLSTSSKKGGEQHV